MSNKLKMIFMGSTLIFLLLLSMIFLFIPKIDLKINGNKIQTIIVGESYTELGAQVYLESLFKKEKLEYKIVGNVDTNKVGEYVITYKSEYNNVSKSAIKIVKVIDNVKPVITLNEEAKLCKKNNLLELNVKAYDNYDGDISKNIKYNLKGTELSLSVTDSSNNKTEVVKSVKLIDEEKPIIKLNGPNIVYINKYEMYDELGATAYDSCDGDITDKIKITSELNANIVGKYKVNYTVKDSSDFETTITRTIIVKDNDFSELPVINEGTIYLTFDDGPSKYTEDILKILDYYNIKATFFVTNQFPDYQHLIKKEYEQGHSIGIHTYSHKWSIYKSVEAYMEDFNKINNIIYEQTGIYTKIFRFPGGSSNTISRNYKKGIMSELSQKLENAGYVYFDWTFDSGDTNKKYNSSKFILKNIKKNLNGNGEYIILLHDIKKNTLEALPSIIEFALSKGYKFSVLTEDSPTEHFKIAN